MDDHGLETPSFSMNKKVSLTQQLVLDACFLSGFDRECDCGGEYVLMDWLIFFQMQMVNEHPTISREQQLSISSSPSILLDKKVAVVSLGQTMTYATKMEVLRGEPATHHQPLPI
jgi:hypothetical protein